MKTKVLKLLTCFWVALSGLMANAEEGIANTSFRQDIFRCQLIGTPRVSQLGRAEFMLEVGARVLLC